MITSKHRPTGKLWLVTGGAGFIGSNIAHELLRRGERVRVLDNLCTGKIERLEGILSRIELMKGDIRALEDCRRAAQGASYVIHQAALRSVPKSVDNPMDSAEVNVIGTLNMLVASREAKALRLVYASSSSAYGESVKFPQRETDTPAPVSPYAASKLAGEHYACLFTKTYGFETVSLRYFNVFGPRQDPESQYSAVIPRFMEQAYRGEPLELHWDGKQRRDFTHISNVVSANLLAALTKKGVGQAFNIANGKNYSLLDLIRAIERCSGKKLKLNRHPKRQGDVRETLADISRAKRLLGYKPLLNFDEGVKDTWNYFVTAYFANKPGIKATAAV